MIVDKVLASLSRKIRTGGTAREVLVKRVADALREQIATGKLKAGSRLMSEVELAHKLEISRPTLREAMRILVQEGLIDIKHGVGAFVASEHQLIWSRLDSMRSFTDLIRSVGGKPSDRLLSIDRVSAAGDVAEALGIELNTPVGLISRVRLIDGAPLSIAQEYLRLSGADDFARLQTFPGGSLYAFLRDRCNIVLARSSVAIAAIAANAQQAALLGVTKGSPLLLLREPHYDVSGQPVLFAVNHHNSTLVHFTVTRAGLRA